MHLNPNKLMYGVAPAILIDCADQLHRMDCSFTFDDFCQALGAPRAEAKPVLDQMVADGFMRLDEFAPDTYAPLPKLSQLALGNVSEGISRAEAERLLAAVIKKAEEINANPERHNCAVDCIVVFGSYLSKKEVLGDLDIGVDVRQLVKQKRQPGQSMRDYLFGAGSPTRQVFASLRLRKPKKISLHELEEVASLKTPFQVVFGELPLKYREPM